MTTPFGAPVVPLVYITTATSSGLGGDGGSGTALGARPAASTASKECTASAGGSFALCAADASPLIVTSSFTCGQSPAIATMHGMSFASAITIGARV